MFKVGLFFAFLSVAFAQDTNSTAPPLKSFFDVNETEICQIELDRFDSCFSSFEEKYAAHFESSGFSVLSNQTLVLEAISDAREGLRCLGEVQCSPSRLIKYMAEGTLFGLEEIYTNAFECITHSNVFQHVFSCAKRYIPQDSAFSRNPFALTLYMRPVAYCTADKLTCSLTERTAFLRGLLALTDVGETLGALEGDTPAFNKTFDPKNIH